MVKVNEFYIFTNRVSILDAIQLLYEDGEILLAGVVLAFSMAFPALKLFVADYVWRGCPVEDRGTDKALSLLGWVSRWSMLDVLVVGLLVVSVKASGLASAASEPGLYAFVGAIMTTTFGVWLLRRAERRLRQG